MMSDTSTGSAVCLAKPHQSEFRRVIRIFLRRKLSVVGLVILVPVIIVALFAPWIAPHDPYSTDVVNKLAAPSSEHLLGTDALGRDTLSRILYASRTSLLVGISAVLLGAAIGQILGLIAGYFGGWMSGIIMRVMDAMMAIPMLILAIVLSIILGGGGLKNVIIALGVGGIPMNCRMMRGQVMSLKEEDYMLAARSLGVRSIRSMLKHIYPNAFPHLLVTMTIGMGGVIMAEAGLSFLGVGISAPQAAWGSMIADGYRFLMSSPLLAIAPGVVLMLVVFGFNMVGDGLRDALDPRLRGTV